MFHRLPSSMSHISLCVTCRLLSRLRSLRVPALSLALSPDTCPLCLSRARTHRSLCVFTLTTFSDVEWRPWRPGGRRNIPQASARTRTCRPKPWQSRCRIGVLAHPAHIRKRAAVSCARARDRFRVVHDRLHACPSWRCRRRCNSHTMRTRPDQHPRAVQPSRWRPGATAASPRGCAPYCGRTTSTLASAC